jgi:hypothetical protein
MSSCDEDNNNVNTHVISESNETKTKKNRIRIDLSSLSTLLNNSNTTETPPVSSTEVDTQCAETTETSSSDEKNGYYYRNRDKKLEYQKNYNKGQGDKIKNYNKEYYQKRREEILEKAKTKIICECGCEVQLFNMNSHKKTKKHARALKENSAI